MLTVHMPFLRNVAALLKICFKNLEGIITSENIMKINLLAYAWLVYVGWKQQSYSENKPLH